ncbi:alpha/beta fold hydrolase [Arenimonas sp. MALMAid1274]|uniref:alpha/beta fold hydrolase n=1 Tax=Arenimonas sp. MALMAid1274 TaxID=3411630 RepID=UPI003B9E98B6
MHGAGGGGWEWGVWVRVLRAAGWQALAPDLQPAPHGLAATALEDYSQQVGAWLGATTRPRVLVGASLGGRLAMLHAAAAEALVLVNPMPPGGMDVPRAEGIKPWGRGASLHGTRRALPDADDLAAQYAFRRWRDESARVLHEASQPLAAARPACPVLVFASGQDADVPAESSAALANAWQASLVRLPGSHVGPLLGRQAARAAAQAVEWLNALDLPR